MKTTVQNLIHFPDGLDAQFISNFKKIFPKEDLEVTLWDFLCYSIPRGYYRMVLTIKVSYLGCEQEEFTYKKTIDDLPLIIDLKQDTKGVVKRKIIMNMVSNDTFIEELDHFLNSIKPIEDEENIRNF